MSVRLIVTALVFCVIVLFVGVPLWFEIVALVFFGGGAVMLIVSSLLRRVAIRVDATGVTLCSSPMFPRSTTRLYPWADLTKVMLWDVRLGGRIARRVTYVGVQRRPGAPELTGRFIGAGARSSAELMAPGLPPGVAITGVSAGTWKLDRDHLASAVATFGPAVLVHDATTGQDLTPPAA